MSIIASPFSLNQPGNLLVFFPCFFFGISSLYSSWGGCVHLPPSRIMNHFFLLKLVWEICSWLKRKGRGITRIVKVIVPSCCQRAVMCPSKKSCTTKDDDYPIIYRVSTIPGGAGFQPSTVVHPKSCASTHSERRIQVLSKHCLSRVGESMAIEQPSVEFNSAYSKFHDEI